MLSGAMQGFCYGVPDLVWDGWFYVDVSWFVKHDGHRLALVSEYGDVRA